jgi:ABC-type polar amino acid transport system ATPase subunit
MLVRRTGFSEGHAEPGGEPLVPAAARHDVSMVFQSFNLFPH